MEQLTYTVEKQTSTKKSCAFFRFMVSLGDYRECSVVIWNAFDGMSTPIVVASAKTFAPMHRVNSVKLIDERVKTLRNSVYL